MDRCNGDPTKRATLLSHASIWSKHPSAIWFDYEPELCISRAQKRLDHPTLPPGSRVRAAVSHHSSIFVPPSLKEGFHTVVRVTSLEASRDLVLSLSPCLGLVKFPRTPHLFNLGAVTADDIVKSPPSNCNDCQIMITEKIDGANMGFSLSSKGCIVAQNRSHYVNSKTHAQFKKLEHFIELNRESLYEILYIDPCFPERYTLYGEWMAATHSIHYDCLNSIFYAFDLYDRVSKTFLGRKALENKLQGTNIPIIPLLWSGTTLPSHEELITMVETTKSNFCMNGILEGIYLKWETTDGTGNVIVKYRCKLVRGDFITGNLHWTKGILRFNKIVQ